MTSVIRSKGPPILPDELDQNARVKLRVASDEALRRILKLIAGTGISIALVDDSVNEEAEVTITTTGAPPTGDAGGVLSGTYPAPGFAADMATQAELDAVDTAADARLDTLETRFGVHLRRATGQTMTNGAFTTISWTVEDEDTHGFIAVTSTNITVPAGAAGIYGAQFDMVFTTAGVTYTFVIAKMLIDGVERAQVRNAGGSGQPGAGERHSTPFAPITLAEGAVVTFQFFQISGANRLFTAELEMYRLSV